jgi:nucleotide-binding universal stress UspA family protein
MFHKIMVPLDGSPESEAALEPAQYMARTAGADILLVRVPGIPDEADVTPVLPIPPEAHAREHARCEKALAERASQLHQAGFKVTWKVLGYHEEPAEQLAAAASDYATDLIVLTSHRRRGLERALKGSVAEKLARHSPCPVLIVGQHS